MDIIFDSVDAALVDIKAGRPVVVVDDAHRENEGDLICAAQFATPDMINFMAVEARGLICLAMTGERLDALDLPLMVSKNTDGNQTAFTVSIDASPYLGGSTGISAEDRARTIQIAINPSSIPEDLTRPGHIFPLRAKDGGVLKRAGHTEASVDLARLSGLYPAGVICEIQNPDGSMARLTELVKYSHKHQLKLISIADLISYRLKHDRFVYREAVSELPSQYGNFRLYAYRNILDKSEHIAIVKGDLNKFENESVMVRMHSECLTGDALGSLRCDCQMQLQAALKMIESTQLGVVVYLRQEGRGIGLINKIKAYSLQDMGFDTVEANEKLGFPADLRDYGVGAQILNDLHIKKIRLITNNPRKIAGLNGYGIEVVERLPLLIEANDYNFGYLLTKAQKLGHLFLRTYLITISLRWDPSVRTIKDRYGKLEKLRDLVRVYGLYLQEEVRPVAISLFDKPSLIFHLGFEQPQSIDSNWYAFKDNPHSIAIFDLLDNLISWQEIEHLECIFSDGEDPMLGLQIKLDRMTFPVGFLPSALEKVERQIIYSFSRA